MLRAYVGQADCCKEPLRAGHIYLRVASVVASKGSEDRIKQFLESLRRNDWSSLQAFNEWNSQKDNLVAHLIRCPNGQGILVAVIDPVELCANPYLLAKSPLDDKEMQHGTDLFDNAEWLALS